jgi:hypothetical protein
MHGRSQTRVSASAVLPSFNSANIVEDTLREIQAKQ